MTRTADGVGGARVLDFATSLQVLSEGTLEQLGLIPWSSNYALLLRVDWQEDSVLAVYKPRRGERPLWDFPAGTLYQREYAAFLVSQALGWLLVPPTILRRGPLGAGTLQVFIDSDPEKHYFNVLPAHADDYRRIALFDVIINNADRKAGHCLLDDNDHMWSIDHGVCFHVEPKLRTVIWDFAGEAIAADVQSDLTALQDQLEPEAALAVRLANLLHPNELHALRQRLAELINAAIFPFPDPNRRNHPWPPI